MLNFLPELLRAVVTVVGAIILARFYLKFIDFPGGDLNRWFGAWVLLSIAAFASGHFLVFSFFVLIAGLIVTRGSEGFAPAAYVLLLPVTPLFVWMVPGFAGINRILGLDLQRILTLVVLLPALLASRQASQARRPLIANAIDFCFLGYCLWMMLLSLIHRDTPTDKLRFFVEYFLFLLIPYLACTRLIRTVAHFRLVIIALAFTGIVECFIAMVEQRLTWWPYRLLPSALSMELPPAFAFSSEMRFGYLRVRAGLEAALGIVLTFALAAFICLWRMKLIQRWKAWTVVALFAMTIFFTGSRGAWLACSLMLAATVGFAFIRTPIRFVFVAALAAFVAPAARDYILGKDDFGTFDYRSELVRLALPMAWDKPILGWGSLEKLYATGRLEELRQGQGIIDFVNTYLGEIVLRGVPGFALFAGALFFSLWSVLVRHRAGGERGFHPEIAAMLASMVVAFAFVLVTISTVSHIPSYLWLLVALCSAFAALPPGTEGDLAEPVSAPAGVRRLRRNGQPSLSSRTVKTPRA